MTGLGIRLYLDEDVDARLAEQLSRLGYDVVSCAGEGNASRGLSDEWQLSYAVSQGRAIVVYNVADYVVVNDDWWRQGKPHNGILVAVAEWHIGELVRRTRHVLDTTAPHEIVSVLRYL